MQTEKLTVTDPGHVTPMFIPLAGRWFDLFETGEKTSEFRRYGRGWTEKSCTPGRPVILSRGYGKHKRLSGTIEGFRIVGPDAHPDIRKVYPDAEKISEIIIRVTGRVSGFCPGCSQEAHSGGDMCFPCPHRIETLRLQGQVSGKNFASGQTEVWNA